MIIKKKDLDWLSKFKPGTKFEAFGEEYTVTVGPSILPNPEKFIIITVAWISFTRERKPDLCDSIKVIYSKKGRLNFDKFI